MKDMNEIGALLHIVKASAEFPQLKPIYNEAMASLVEKSVELGTRQATELAEAKAQEKVERSKQATEDARTAAQAKLKLKAEEEAALAERAKRETEPVKEKSKGLWRL